MSDPIANTRWKKVAVTGATGSIGCEVARRLHELGYSLVLLDKNPATDPVGPFIQTDLRNREAVRAALEGVDAVCHIGEIPNVLAGMTGQEVFDTNTETCRTMLDVSRNVGVKRFIYTSSCQVYGYWGAKEFPANRLPTIWPLDESQPVAPANDYARSKVFNEQQCAAAAMQVLIFRFPWVVPLRPDVRTDRHWDRSDHCLFEGFWTYLDTRDAVEAYVCGLNPTANDFRSAQACEAFHFVCDEIVGDLPIRDKMQVFLPHWPTLPANWGTHAPPISLAKAERLLGWKPRYRMSAVIHRDAEQTGK